MTVLFAVCAVIVTLTFVVLAVAAVRALLRFEKTALQLEMTAQTARDTLAEASRVSREVHELVTLVQEAVPPIRRVTERFQSVGDRAAGIASAVLDEIEAPVRAAVKVVRGARGGASAILEMIMRRKHTATHNGGYGHE